MERIFTFPIILLMTTSFCAQSHNIHQPKQRVASTKISGKPFEEVSLFSLKTKKHLVSIPKEFKNYAILSLRSFTIKNFASSLSKTMSLLLPGKKTSMLLELVKDKGDPQEVSDYIQSICNQIVILYSNENVKIKLSGISLWASSISFNNLNYYPNYRNRNGFDADLGHFVTYNYSGGVPWINSICGLCTYDLSGINRNYNNTP